MFENDFYTNEGSEFNTFTQDSVPFNSDYGNNISKKSNILKTVLIMFSVVVVAIVVIFATGIFNKDDKTTVGKSEAADISEIGYTTPLSDCTVKLSKRLSLQENDKYGYVINVAITNNSDKDIDGWQIKLSLANNITLTETWEASFTLDDANSNIIYITPLDINSTIVSNSNVTCGFIAYSDSTINLEDIVVDFQDSTFTLQ